MLTAASPWVLAGLGLAGLLVGRLLNLAIDRLPEGGRLGGAWPRCSDCGRPLPPVIHVPVVGFTVLRRRCPFCGASLSWRTPVVEFLAGALFVYVGYRWGISAVGLVALLYISILLVTAAIDLERQLILNSIVYPAALVALALAPWGPPGQDASGWRAYLSALEGGALAFGVLLLIYVLSRGGVGEGGVKLGAFLGLALGLRGALVVLPLSFVIGGLVAIGLWAIRRVRRGSVVPFGPALAVGGLLSLFWGEVILDWYRGLFGF